MVKLKENELSYALAVLRGITPGHSVLTVELEGRHPARIVEWLKDKELLITTMLEADDSVIERRTVLGKRASNIINTINNFDAEVKLLRSINEA